MTRRTRTPKFCSAALVLSVVVVAGSCGGGGKHDTQSSITSPKVLAVKTSVLKIGTVDVQSAGPPNVQIDTPTGKAVLAAAQEYIDTAIFAPLKNGALGSGYGALFDAGVRPAATGSDRHALTDLAVGKVTNLSTKATPVDLSALAGTLGELMYVATRFDLTVKGALDARRLTITHHIELTFAKTAKTWLVTAYRIQSVRKSAAATTTTSAAAGTTTT